MVFKQKKLEKKLMERETPPLSPFMENSQNTYFGGVIFFWQDIPAV